MNLRRLLLYPPASWILSWGINDPGRDAAQERWLHSLINSLKEDGPNMAPPRRATEDEKLAAYMRRLTRRPTDEAKAAAKVWEDLTGWYGVHAVGRDIQLTVSVDQLGVLIDQWRAANPETAA